MKNTIKVAVKDKYTAFAYTYLSNGNTLTDKLFTVVAALFKHWKPNVNMDEDWKNLVCEEIGYDTPNKYALLNAAIRDLTNTHVKLKVTINGKEVIESSPIVIPVKYLRSKKSRELKLHPILEKGLLVLQKEKEVELITKYVWT